MLYNAPLGRRALLQIGAKGAYVWGKGMGWDCVMAAVFALRRGATRSSGKSETKAARSRLSGVAADALVSPTMRDCVGNGPGSRTARSLPGAETVPLEFGGTVGTGLCMGDDAMALASAIDLSGLLNGELARLAATGLCSQ